MGRRRSSENSGFICEYCGTEVLATSDGSYRNHCPACLSSKHLDTNPGDRTCECRGLMLAVALRINRLKGYQLVHECQRCGERRVNRIVSAGIQPDDIEVLAYLPVVS